MLLKSEIRAKLKAERQKIAPLIRKKAAEQAAILFRNHSLLQTCFHCACYLSLDTEFDTMPIIQALWNMGKKCYLPILSKQKENQLDFVCYKAGDELQRNRYHILEPKNISAIIEPEKLDLVLLPLIAFDRKGHRIGTGAGYYDRTFSFLREQSVTKPILWGLAYEMQRVEILPADPWDIPLHGVVTEQGIFFFL